MRWKPDKLVVPEPTEPTPIEILDKILKEVDAEVRKPTVPGQECLPRYWQGKKDGIRIAMVVLINETDRVEAESIKRLQITSRVSRYTSGEEDELQPLSTRKGNGKESQT